MAPAPLLASMLIPSERSVMLGFVQIGTSLLDVLARSDERQDRLFLPILSAGDPARASKRTGGGPLQNSQVDEASAGLA